MKEFDFEKAKAGHPVCTRDGRRARIICYDLISIANKPIEAILPYPKGNEYEGYEYIQAYTREGYILSENEKCDDDLMLAGIKKEGWVYIWRDDYGDTHVDGVFNSEKDAKDDVEISYFKEKFVAVAKIEWEED